jgi:apolipoprotein N-acyltransferase
MAAFAAPLFIMRFLRLQSPMKGLLMIVFAGFVANVFIWQGMMPISGPFYYVLAFMMSLFTSLVFTLDRIYTGKIKGFISTLFFPSAYVVMDFITISTNPSGSFGTLGHTQDYLALLQILSITGIWGVTFIVLWSASVVNWLWDGAFEKTRLKQAFGAFVIPIFMILLFGQIRLALHDSNPTVRIASIKISKTALSDRYNRDDHSLVEKSNDLFLANCTVAASSGAKIVFGIETVIRLPYDQEADFIGKAKALAISNRIYLGLPMQVLTPDMLPMNKIVWLSPRGEILNTYHKANPTPGEGKYGDGRLRYFDSPYGRICSAICFDMDFPAFINQISSDGIDIMLVPGMDWREISPYHTYVASFRAIEHGFNMVRAVTKGLSASFNYKGQLLSSQDHYTSDDLIMYSDVPTRGQKTLYSWLGDYFAWLCVLFFLSAIFVFFRRSRQVKPSPGLHPSGDPAP